MWSTHLALFGGLVRWWQLVLLGLLVVLLIAWKKYRSKQM
jgi:hypothetical protein